MCRRNSAFFFSFLLNFRASRRAFSSPFQLLQPSDFRERRFLFSFHLSFLHPTLPTPMVSGITLFNSLEGKPHRVSGSDLGTAYQHYPPPPQQSTITQLSKDENHSARDRSRQTKSEHSRNKTQTHSI